LDQSRVAVLQAFAERLEKDPARPRFGVVLRAAG